MDNRLTAQLAQTEHKKIDKGNVLKSDLNKNSIKFDGTWFEPEFLEELNFKIAEKSNLLKPDIMQVALGLHPTYFEEITVQRDVEENIFEKSQKEMGRFLEIFNKNKNF